MPAQPTCKENFSMSYVDGFIIAVPKKNLAEYKRIAKLSAKVWKDHGALEVKECVADDVKVGKLTSFPRAVIRKPSETVIFSYIVYKSRADRDKINAKVMKDPRLNELMSDPTKMPFDTKRMIFGGFDVIVDE
jgi:uncharacterized protein YbaA (DUF1428 family)